MIRLPINTKYEQAGCVFFVFCGPGFVLYIFRLIDKKIIFWTEVWKKFQIRPYSWIHSIYSKLFDAQTLDLKGKGPTTRHNDKDRHDIISYFLRLEKTHPEPHKTWIHWLNIRSQIVRNTAYPCYSSAQLYNHADTKTHIYSSSLTYIIHKHEKHLCPDICTLTCTVL